MCPTLLTNTIKRQGGVSFADLPSHDRIFWGKIKVWNNISLLLLVMLAVSLVISSAGATENWVDDSVQDSAAYYDELIIMMIWLLFLQLDITPSIMILEALLHWKAIQRIRFQKSFLLDKKIIQYLNVLKLTDPISWNRKRFGDKHRRNRPLKGRTSALQCWSRLFVNKEMVPRETNNGTDSSVKYKIGQVRPSKRGGGSNSTLPFVFCIRWRHTSFWWIQRNETKILGLLAHMGWETLSIDGIW